MGPNGNDSLSITQKIYFKNGNTRTEFLPSNNNPVVLNIGKDMITLMNDTERQLEYFYGGFIPVKAKGKYYTKDTQDKDDMTGNFLYRPNVTYTNEKKIIAGYECKKVIVDFAGSYDTTVFWVTDKIVPINSSGISRGFDKINGAILEEENSYSVTAVFAVPVADSLFKIPKEYVDENRISKNTDAVFAYLMKSYQEQPTGLNTYQLSQYYWDKGDYVNAKHFYDLCKTMGDFPIPEPYTNEMKGKFKQ